MFHSGECRGVAHSNSQKHVCVERTKNNWRYLHPTYEEWNNARDGLSVVCVN